MRAAILFAALVVLATATFADANAWIEPLPMMRQLPIAARIALLYVPYAILVGVLFLVARIPARVQGKMGWYIALAILAVGVVVTPYVSPALMLVAALVLMQLTPRVGNLYDAQSFPSIRAFLGLTRLVAISIKWGADLFGIEFVLEKIPAVPLNAMGAIVAAVAVAAFIMVTRVRHRRVQPCGAAGWLLAGIIFCMAGALAAHLPSTVPYGFYAAASLLIASHVMLFVGAFLLFSHLLPIRGADEQH